MVDGCFILVMAGFALFGMLSGEPLSFAMAAILILPFVIRHYYRKSKENRKKRQAQDALARIMARYQPDWERMPPPASAAGVFCAADGGIKGLVSGVIHYCWLDGDSLCFFPAAADEGNHERYLGHTTFGRRIPLDRIEKFERGGEVYRDTRVSGGIDLGGAVAGGLLMGGIGAVIGGMVPVTSTTVTHDTRETLLLLEGVESLAIYFPMEAYDVFLRLMPAKEGLVVDEVRRRRLVEEQLRGSP